MLEYEAPRYHRNGPVLRWGVRVCGVDFAMKKTPTIPPVTIRHYGQNIHAFGKRPK